MNRRSSRLVRRHGRRRRTLSTTGAAAWRSQRSAIPLLPSMSVSPRLFFTLSQHSFQSAACRWQGASHFTIPPPVAVFVFFSTPSKHSCRAHACFLHLFSHSASARSTGVMVPAGKDGESLESFPDSATSRW